MNTVITENTAGYKDDLKNSSLRDLPTISGVLRWHDADGMAHTMRTLTPSEFQNKDGYWVLYQNFYFKQPNPLDFVHDEKLNDLVTADGTRLSDVVKTARKSSVYETWNDAWDAAEAEISDAEMIDVQIFSITCGVGYKKYSTEEQAVKS